jgi:hypothetical protein
MVDARLTFGGRRDEQRMWGISESRGTIVAERRINNLEEFRHSAVNI